MGTIVRPNAPLAASDGYGEVDENESTIYTLVNGNLNHENFASDGIRNTNIDKDEVFTTETWDNILQGGHFPLWSSETDTVPDSWTAELTATIAQDTAPTYAPSTHYSCKIEGDGAALEGIYQTLALRKNATYAVGLKVKATAGDTAVVKIVDGDSAEKASQEYTDADWQTDDNRKYFTFTTGTTTNAGAITIKLLAKADGDIVWFGEVQITEGEMAKGYQYQSTNADTVDGFNADDTAADANLVPYSGIPRMLIAENCSDSSTDYWTVTMTNSNTYYEFSQNYKVYLPAKTTEIEYYIYFDDVYDQSPYLTLKVEIGSVTTESVGVGHSGAVWVTDTITTTDNATEGGWYDVKFYAKSPSWVGKEARIHQVMMAFK